MEFKGTKGELFSVEYAGLVFIQDSEFYEDSDKCNVLDFDYVGQDAAIANGRLFASAPEMFELLKELSGQKLFQKQMSRTCAKIETLLTKITE